VVKRMRKVWDVEPQADGRWAVRREGSKRADSIHDAKEAAVERSIELGRRHGGHVRIKGRDGRIQDERTYTQDPRPPGG
jgi:Uncharacterized protein conserved in bacteria (DUF2188)